MITAELYVVKTGVTIRELVGIRVTLARREARIECGAFVGAAFDAGDPQASGDKGRAAINDGGDTTNTSSLPCSDSLRLLINMYLDFTASSLNVELIPHF